MGKGLLKLIILLLSILLVTEFGLLSQKAISADMSTWQEIKKNGRFRLGVTPSEPWYFKEPKSKEWSGCMVDLGKEIADVMGVKLELVETTWGNAVAALQANQIDVMFVLDATPKRALAIDFPSNPLLYYALGALVREDSKIKTWQDMNNPNVKISVTMGTSFDRIATTRCPKADISRYPTHDEAVASFQAGRSDMVLIFHPALVMFHRKIGMGKIILPEPIVFSASSAGVRREADTTWRDFLNTCISYYYITGKTQELYENFLKSRGINPEMSPSIMKERW